MLVDDIEETALAVYLVSEGIDRYRVGFLRRFLVKHKKKYDGRLAQITEIIRSHSESPSDCHKYHRNKGCCHVILLETVPFSQHSSSGEDEDKEAPQKKQRTIVDSQKNWYYSNTATILLLLLQHHHNQCLHHCQLPNGRHCHLEEQHQCTLVRHRLHNHPHQLFLRLLRGSKKTYH